MAFLVPQPVKHRPAIWEPWVWSLGWEDPLEKAMATHSSILAWKTPWMEEPGSLQFMGSQRVGHNWATWLSFPKSLQSCLTLCDLMDCTVHGILQARILEWVAIPFSRKEIFPTQGSNPGLSHSRQILYWLSHQGSPYQKIEYFYQPSPTQKLLCAFAINFFCYPWSQQPSICCYYIFSFF